VISTKKCLLVASALTLGLAIPAASASATAVPHTSADQKICLPVHAKGVGQDLGNGQTTATISAHGVVLGTTNASFTPTGQTGSVLSFTGPILFTPAAPEASGSTLTVEVTGTFDTATGRFESTSTSVTGTGLLAPVTGHLRIKGSESLTDGSFTEKIRGRLCVALPS
jgi:polyisoprenoid-binding protein YceI